MVVLFFYILYNIIYNTITNTKDNYDANGNNNRLGNMDKNRKVAIISNKTPNILAKMRKYHDKLCVIW